MVAESQYVCVFSPEKHALIELPNMFSYVQDILQFYEGSNFLYQVYLIRVVVRSGGRRGAVVVRGKVRCEAGGCTEKEHSIEVDLLKSFRV